MFHFRTRDTISNSGVNCHKQIPRLEYREVINDGGAYNELLLFQITFYTCLEEERHCRQQTEEVFKKKTLQTLAGLSAAY